MLEISKPPVFLIAGLAVVFLVISVELTVALQPVDRDAINNTPQFTIERGDGLREIADNLHNNQLIRASKAFKIYSLLSASAHRFKPGIYEISSSWNAAQIAQVLVAGPAETEAFITEGSTVKDIDAKLGELGIIKNGELNNFNWRHLEEDYPFLQKADSLEGFLLPDTYRFAQFSPIKIVVREMLGNFIKQAWPLIENSDDYYNKIIVASLIEKEAPFSGDRRIISGIIYKRMRLGMPLQIDATVAYAKCDERFLTCSAADRRLSKSDLAIDNNFNTYLNKGLPPAPIANFGIDALKAAIAPQNTSYLYYISDPRSKKTIFAATLEEHNNNRIKYLR
ncbi:MAG: endolytic transglycosylase MltG [Patescibacteria group bacterium]